MKVIVTPGGHTVLQCGRSAITIAHRQRIYRQSAQADTGNIEFRTRPLPATEAMQCNPCHQTHAMRPLGQLLEWYRRHPPAPDATRYRAQIGHLYIAAINLPAARAFAPNRFCRRPNRVLQQEQRRLACAKANKIDTIGSAHGRQHKRHPVGIFRQFVLLLLGNRKRFEIAFQRQLLKLGFTENGNVGHFAQQLLNHDLLTRRGPGANLLSTMAHGDFPHRIELKHQRAGIRTCTVIFLDLSKTHSVAAPRVFGVVRFLGLGPIGP